MKTLSKKLPNSTTKKLLNQSNMSKIAEIALSYVGQREIKGNMGFVNPDFDKKMRGV